MRRSWFAPLLAMLAALFVAAGTSAQEKTFKQEELDQLLAPIALYPDSLLAQVLMAATYPADVAEAAKWAKANPKAQGDAAVKSVENEPWDPSVQSLAAFPSVLAMMGDKPEWVQSLGDAFLAQPDDVMSTAQGLRKRAEAQGSLKTTEQQRVVTETVEQKTVIRIEPAQPQVVYVPAYNPTIVYGPWWYPYYPPPFYWPPPPIYGFGYGIAAGIGFGIGIGITNALWGGCNWGRNEININVNRYNNINVNRRLDARGNDLGWKHNAANRKGTPYRDAKTREQYGKKVPGAENRRDYRGKADDRSASRDRAAQAMKDRGVDPAASRERLRSVDRERAQAAARDANRATRPGSGSVAGRDNAFSGVNRPTTRPEIDRGVASRDAMTRPAPRPDAGRPSMQQRPTSQPQGQRPAPRPQASRPAPRPQVSRPAPRPPASRPAPRGGGGRHR